MLLNLRRLGRVGGNGQAVHTKDHLLTRATEHVWQRFRHNGMACLQDIYNPVEPGLHRG